MVAQRLKHVHDVENVKHVDVDVGSHVEGRKDGCVKVNMALEEAQQLEHQNTSRRHLHIMQEQGQLSDDVVMMKVIMIVKKKS